ncbi:MAG: hypothetical protein ACKPKO_03825, partial [Candidatus Fonsibacter sp.]
CVLARQGTCMICARNEFCIGFLTQFKQSLRLFMLTLPNRAHCGKCNRTLRKYINSTSCVIDRALICTLFTRDVSVINLGGRNVVSIAQCELA